MKYWFIVFSLWTSLNTFGQLQIDKSKTVTFDKSQILANKKGKTFVQNFKISNSENQPFITANIVLEGNFSIDVELLVRYKIFEWQEWQHLVEDIHLRKDGFIYKEMFYLPQGVSEFEIKFKAGSKLNELGIDFFYPEFTENLTARPVVYNDAQGAQAVNCNCPMPAFETRLDWCLTGNCPEQTSPTYTTVTHLIVHHAAGPNTSADWAATVRGIWNYHVNTRGWSDIGYNYLIDPNGIIYEGRGDNVLGAHFSAMNGGTMGICLLGDYEPTSGNGTPSNIMISKLEELLSWKECDLDIDPLLSAYHTASSQTLFNISGHRDAGTGTLCPGDNVYNLMQSIRTTCSSYMTNCSFVSNADLVVSAVSTNPNSVILNEPVTIDYSIGNGGSQSVTDSITVELKIDGVLYETQYVDSLSHGGIASFSITNYVFDTIGNHTVCVYISTASNETNTVNNSYCKTINVSEDVSLSDISITSFYVNNDNISILEEAEIFFNFKNVGDVSTAEPVLAKIKVDNVVKRTITIPVLAENASFADNFTYNFNTIGQHEFCLEVESPSNETIVANNSDCEPISVFPISAIESFENDINLKIFPNPVVNLLQVSLLLDEKEAIYYELNNVLGQTMLAVNSDELLLHELAIDVKDLASGIYILKLNVGNYSINKTVVIE